MPVKKYQSVEEMPDSWLDRDDPRLLDVIAAVWRRGANAQRDERGLVAGGSVAAGVAAIGVGLTVVLAARGKEALDSLGDWDAD